MAKFAINHPNEFESSGAAIMTGLLYAVIMGLISLACVIKMCNTDKIITTLNSYVAFAAVAMTPNFAYLALPVGHPFKAVSPELKSLIRSVT